MDLKRKKIVLKMGVKVLVGYIVYNFALLIMHIVEYSYASYKCFCLINKKDDELVLNSYFILAFVVLGILEYLNVSVHLPCAKFCKRRGKKGHLTVFQDTIVMYILYIIKSVFILAIL